ncbi:hypothetical protein [Alloactinosynnema sp. L-07]|uniref:hypothetical protein n=1 Tax=Alloactinosynnema sp. L-07 TaxID=1653480 RepID=UPI00065EFFDC|nr:hypothetical protein [Alloactinosynnema sp. L-07]CRK57329.1 hypothetical protein [Alloactinosynnema sp. L-07]
MLAAVSSTPVVDLGARLRASVAKVVADVGRSGVVDELRAGLAWTAACGQTCQLTGPVARVRQAVGEIQDGDLAAAEASLRRALAALR